MTPDSFSPLHKIRPVEIFHFYLGDPVQWIQITEAGEIFAPKSLRLSQVKSKDRYA